MKEIILKLEDVHVRYGGVEALGGVTISLGDGEIVALMGPNGAGKSTILRAAFGLAAMERGKMFWHGSHVTPVPHKVVEWGISFVPQGRRVFPHLTVSENLDVGGFIVRDAGERRRRIEEAMEIFPALKHKKGRKAANLSGGEQQMLALARGLITDPKVLLLDEPSLGLAPKIVKEVFLKIKEVNERHGTAVLVVEHNIVSLLRIASRAYVLDKGRVAAEGESEEIMKSGALEKVFLGGAT